MPQAKKRPTTTTKRSTTKNKKVTIASSKRFRILGLAFVVLFAGIGVWALAASKAATTTIDTTDKAAVNSAYWSLYGNNASVTAGWNGSVGSCTPGNISESARITQLNAVNFARRLSGLTPVAAARLSDSVQANVQRAALMMDANETLDHTPPSSWRCYKSNGATAASQSNLTIGGKTSAGVEYPLKPLDVISSYLKDYGSGNDAVGHRRWILYPKSSVFAFGMTNHAAATQVLGLRTSSTNFNPSYVPWPSDHWFPTPLDPERSGDDAPGGNWSLSGRASACFNNATVSVTRNGYGVATTVISRGAHYGNPTIVWRMPRNLDHSGVYAYVVNVSNINQTTTSGACSTSSSTRTSYQYPVRFFTPYK